LPPLVHAILKAAERDTILAAKDKAGGMQEATQIIEHYGLAVVFLSVLLDKAGLPIPSYPVLLVAGALSASGGSPALAVLAAAVAGAAISDLLCYGAGVKFGRSALSLVCRVSLSPDCVCGRPKPCSRAQGRGHWYM